MRGVILGFAFLFFALAWLILLVATGFNLALAGSGVLVVLCVSGSTSSRDGSAGRMIRPH